MFVIEPDTLGREFQRLALLGRQRIVSCLSPFQRNLQLSHPGGVQTVKTIGVFDQGGIAPTADIGDHIADGLGDRGIGYGIPAQDLFECRPESIIHRAQALDLCHEISAFSKT